MSVNMANPYELTLAGITCKTSPFGNGFYISEGDLDALGDKAEKFKAVLFELYDVQQNKQLVGIKVFGLKPEKEKKNEQVNVQGKK